MRGGQEQQRGAALNASWNPFQSARFWCAFHFPSSSVSAAAATNDGCLARCLQSTGEPACRADAGERRAEGRGRAALPALLLRGLFQGALRSSRTLEPLRGDGSLVGHALPHHVSFPPQSDLLPERRTKLEDYFDLCQRKGENQKASRLKSFDGWQ